MQVSGQITPSIQRKREEEEELIQAKHKVNADKRIVSHGIGARIKSLRGGGQPLPESVRNNFEPRFGCDFGDIRVHADSSTAETSRQLNAEAFTSG